jgi:hypothetical protein
MVSMPMISVVLLCLGVVGFAELVFIGLLAAQLSSAGVFEWLHPGSIYAKIGVWCIAMGFIGMIVFAVEMIGGARRLWQIKAMLVFTNIAMFIWAGWLHLDA